MPAPRLFHTTSWREAEKALKTGKITSISPFISLSEKPLFGGDIRHGDVALVLDAGGIKGQLVKVEYTERWAEANPEQTSYIAGEGWREQFTYPEDCVDEEGWEDDECMERAYHEAEVDSFLWKSDEAEWLTKREGAPLSVGGAITGLLVPDERSKGHAESLMGGLGLDLPVFIGRGASAVRVAKRFLLGDAA